MKRLVSIIAEVTWILIALVALVPLAAVAYIGAVVEALHHGGLEELRRLHAGMKTSTRRARLAAKEDASE